MVEGSGHLLCRGAGNLCRGFAARRPTVHLGAAAVAQIPAGRVYQDARQKKLDFLLGLPVIGKLIGKKVLRGLGLDSVKHAGRWFSADPGSLSLPGIASSASIWLRIRHDRGLRLFEHLVDQSWNALAMSVPPCLGSSPASATRVKC